ncbi:MAG: hypothetical protein HUK24_03775 [Sphaerochaetaceae bacterium]|nr:hypothetical protein [Sphaerochaetaceae bacterium]
MTIFAQKLSEDAKWFIIAIFLIFIVFFAAVGFLGFLVKKLMHWQGGKMESMIADVVNEHIITDTRKLRKFGIKKNIRYLFKEAWIPFSIMALVSIIYVIFCAANNFEVRFFGYAPGERGFMSLFFIWDWKNPEIRGDVFFLKNIIIAWPPALNTPRWDWNAWGTYLFGFGIVIGGLWFLYCVQAYIARSWRLMKVSKKVFEKKLDNFDPNSVPPEAPKPEQ